MLIPSMDNTQCVSVYTLLIRISEVKDTDIRLEEISYLG